MVKKLYGYIFEFLKKRLDLVPVDFSQAWWKVITNQRFYVTCALGGELIYSAFKPLVILWLGVAFSYGNFHYFVLIFLIWAGQYVLSLFARICLSILQMRAVYSVHYQAHRWFLQVDPLYHAERCSGAILSKIDSASRSYEDCMTSFTLDWLQTFAGVTTVIITFLFQSWRLAFVTAFFLGFIVLIMYVASIYLIIPFEEKLIEADDKFRGVSVENLAQVGLIRSAFASNESMHRLYSKGMKALYEEGDLGFLYCFFYFFIKILYLTSMMVVGWYILDAVKGGSMSAPVGISTLLAYLQGTYDIVRIEQPMRILIKSITRIKELFSFVNKFGKQNFPVLEKVTPAARFTIDTPVAIIKVQATDLTFSYRLDVPLFNHHTFTIFVPSNQKNKLYGVIGPSGIGKSTLFAMIGGQIKPTTGHVFVNDIDIYQVDDIARRQVLAVQGQISTNVRGTLKYNLLFGLPIQEINKFSDNDLIDLLHSVGLWATFQAKEGLETFIGEAGLTLSGGQRQRLNFANLYLRAQYYKPYVILIDEPTSSLDEVSEQAITDIILTLAKDAVTLVIAHRLNTIKNAAGIIDCSLMSESAEIIVHSQEQLKDLSSYYRRLLGGQVSIEE